MNIAVARALKGRKVLLVDADDQKSASIWSEKREELKTKKPITTVHLTGSSVLSQVKKLSKDYDDVIIDVGGRDTASLRAAILVCDFFVTPFRPRSLDIWTIQMLEDLIKEAKSINTKVRVFSVLNQADARGTDNKDALSILKESAIIKPLQCVVSHRKVFANAASEGMGILEYSPIDKKGEKELKSLISKIY